MSTPQQEQLQILKSFFEARRTCTVPWVLNYETPLPGSSPTLHQIFMIVAGGATLINIVITSYLIQGHVRHWTKPNEQKQCLRIIAFVIVVSLTSFFSIVFYNASGFIIPAGQYYGGFAIIALLLLYVELASPNETSREAFYNTLEHKLRSGKNGKNQGSLSWFRIQHPQCEETTHLADEDLQRSHVMVFQIAITRIVTVVASEVLAMVRYLEYRAYPWAGPANEPWTSLGLVTGLRSDQSGEIH